jgi:hypothetical protein
MNRRLLFELLPCIRPTEHEEHCYRVLRRLLARLRRPCPGATAL